MRIILASQSPRRRQLMEEAGIRFEVMVCETDERLSPEEEADPVAAAQALADKKAGAVVQMLLANPQAISEPTMVIGADTMVVCGGRIFGKPHSASEAKGMLRKMSGVTHQVVTGVAVWGVQLDAQGKAQLAHRTISQTSQVTFKPLTDEQIDAYLREGESYDKAGAYAIQGKGAALVESYEGAYDNIIGLPLQLMLETFPGIADERA